MNKKIKNITLALIILLSITFISACTDDVQSEKYNLKTTVALLEEKLSEKDENDLLFNVNDEVLKLKVNNKDILDKLEENEIYTIAYDLNSNTLKAHSPYDFEYAKEPEIEYAKEEPVLGNPGNPIVMSSEELDIDELTLIDSFEYDFSESESEDKISLYTSAEKDEDGELMLDDGQQWTLLVETEEGHFVLFNDYIQMGEIQFKILTKDEDEFNIIVLQDDVASIKITEFMFDEDTNTFVPFKKYETEGNINMLH